MQQDYDNQYQELLDFRSVLISYTTQYDGLTDVHKEEMNIDFENFFKDSGIEVRSINHFWNHINALADQGNVKEIQKAKLIFNEFSTEFSHQYGLTLSNLGSDTEPDGFFANKIKSSLSNSFGNGLIADSKELREENRASFSLSDEEKEGIKNLSGYFKKITAFNRRERENIDKLLNIDFPSTPYDGIYVKRCKVNSYDLGNTFGSDIAKENEFATVIFKGDSPDNIMYLTLKGTDFHVKVRMDPDTKEVQIDKDHLYKKDKYGKWESSSTADISKKVSEGLLDKRNKNIKKDFRNFGVIGMSDVNGIRKVSILHNLKSHSYNLQSELSRDVFNDQIDNSTKVTDDNELITAVNSHIFKSSTKGDGNGSEHSDSGIEDSIRNSRKDVSDKIMRTINSVTNYHESLLAGYGKISDNIDRDNADFSYAVSKNIYEEIEHEGETIQAHAGYELQRIEFGDDTIGGVKIEKTERKYMSLEDFNAMTSAMSEIKKSKKNGEIDDETYKMCKDYVLNKFDEIVSVRNEGCNNLIEILQIKENGTDDIKKNAKFFKSTENYNKIVAKTGDKAYASEIISESMVPTQTTIRRMIAGHDSTKGIESTSKAKKLGHNEIDKIEGMSSLVQGLQGEDIIAGYENVDKAPKHFQNIIKNTGSSNVGRGSGGSSPAA